tara:strand:+ start:192 stop:458 length:267 start_codon:yes stop_codon:yes gene_type:complete
MVKSKSDTRSVLEKGEERMKNNYAKQLGYGRDLDLLFDFYDVKDLQLLIEYFYDNVSATHELDEVVNEMVGDLVDNNPNLKADVIIDE